MDLMNVLLTVELVVAAMVVSVGVVLAWVTDDPDCRREIWMGVGVAACGLMGIVCLLAE